MADDARILIGLMSGTSADGVDAAAVRITGRGRGMSATLIQHTHKPYPHDLRAHILRLRSEGNAGFDILAGLTRKITLAHAEAAKACMKAAALSAGQVAALAVHGQTFFHEPPDTMQLFDPALLAWHTGCAVVSDFRRADLAAGGQGAPLVPFADWLLFRHETKHRVLLNLGGIANLTYLPAGCALDDVIAFDCGPANCLSDRIMHMACLGDFDRNGERALLGEVRQDLVAAFLDGPFAKQRPPKSTDTWAMIDAFHDACDAVDIDSDWTDFQLGCSPHARPEHLNMLLATSNATVAACVDLALDWCGDNADASRREHGRLRRGRYTGELIVTGGGAANASIMRELQQRTGVTPQTGVNLGMPPEAKEAVAFALLGAATLDREPSNVPSATGASRSVVLGSITPKPC